MYVNSFRTERLEELYNLFVIIESEENQKNVLGKPFRSNLNSRKTTILKGICRGSKKNQETESVFLNFNTIKF